MSKLLLGSIDLTKIDKTQIVDKDKDGNPFKNGGKFINIAVWVNDEADQYGNHASIKMGEKDNSVYIGNLKEWKKQGEQQSTAQPTAQDNSDLPF